MASSEHLGQQFLPFYHGTAHTFKEGDKVDDGWVTRSRIIATMYGNNVYQVSPDNPVDPGYGGHKVIRQVDPDYRDEDMTESIGRWEVDKDDPLWDSFR